MRIALAKLLLARPNLLLMDEPTNHLDLPARNWLEEYLADYPGSVVLVSHDRYFLDATVKRITEVGLKTLTDYHGNYSHYVDRARGADGARCARRTAGRARRSRRPRSSSTASATRPPRPGRSRAGSSSSRRSSGSSCPPERKKIRFKFPQAPRPGRVVLEFEGRAQGYGENVVLAPPGPDGRARGSRSRSSARTAPASRRSCASWPGRPHADEGVRLGPQGRSSTTSPRTRRRPQPARGPCSRRCPRPARVSMAPDDPHDPRRLPVRGGRRLQEGRACSPAASATGSPSRRCCSTRPTSCSSTSPRTTSTCDSKDVLLDALEDYGGTLVFVSHDRYFVDKLATKVIEVGGGEAPLYPGGYEDFLYWKTHLASPLALPPDPSAAARGPGRRDRLGRDEGGPFG